MKTNYQSKCKCCNGSGKMRDYKRIGESARRARKLAGLTMGAVAKRCNWSTTFQSYVERGVRPLSDEQLAVLMEVLH